MTGYAPLWCKSNYSFLEGASDPRELVEECRHLGIRSLAVTDRDGVHGIVRAHVAAKEEGIHLVVGSEMTVKDGSTIVLLAMDRGGDLIIIELKRDRTPRDVIAQTLDYASWVHNVTTRQVLDLALERFGRPLETVFAEKYDAPLPDNLNSNHSMLVVASELDASSRRIVEYLSQAHGLNINTAFFTVFDRDGVLSLRGAILV